MKTHDEEISMVKNTEMAQTLLEGQILPIVL